VCHVGTVWQCAACTGSVHSLSNAITSTSNVRLKAQVAQTQRDDW
jgi:hypothetical protein